MSKSELGQKKVRYTVEFSKSSAEGLTNIAEQEETTISVQVRKGVNLLIETLAYVSEKNGARYASTLSDEELYLEFLKMKGARIMDGLESQPTPPNPLLPVISPSSPTNALSVMDQKLSRILGILEGTSSKQE